MWGRCPVISVLQASRDWNYQRGRSRTTTGEKGTHVGRNCRGSEAEKQGHRQEQARGFLWEIRENWQQGGEAGQTGKERAWDTSKSLQLAQGVAGSIRGFTKVTRWCTQLISWLCPKFFGVVLCKGPFHEGFRAICLVNCPCDLG